VEGCRSGIERHTEDRGGKGRGSERDVQVAGGCTEWGNTNRVDNSTAGRRLPSHEGHQGDPRNRAVEADNCLDKKSND